MEVIKITKEYYSKNKSVIALGNFDGVHIGHRKLIETLVKNAKKQGIKSSVLIFKEHTKNLLNKRKQYLLTSNDEKYRIFKSLGVDYIYEIVFDESIMTMTPEYFVSNFLIEHLNVDGIVVGFDYRFGYKASGNTETLKKLTIKYKISLSIIEPVEKDGVPLSSTNIRELIKSGNIEKANELLGHYYTIDGEVIHGKNLGQKMGYPTANIEPDVKYVIPHYGVYDSDIVIDEKIYRAATNIGKNPTIENSGLRVEAHIVDFSENIYGKNVSIRLRRFLRPELKFNTVEELFAQIKKDVEDVKLR